ncbi:hypothetical protein [Bacteroides eggerthii]|uniref:hypothetical protein n=1 Tax=Bacteroides eggerthii TaxID=28111 RepID=UPI000E4B6ADA|nr:hypothetical protein [Bacteroides eggerthii]RHB93890.1 hypothetical protein DW866_09425 [Bacteroides eggerthii]
MNIDYKALDTQKVVDYILSFSEEVLVVNIIQNSGADKLRVYPALFELEQNGFLEVVEREELGAPLVVRRRRDASQV